MDERNASKHDVRTGKFGTLKKTKETLVEELLSTNVVAKGSEEDVANVVKKTTFRLSTRKKKQRKVELAGLKECCKFCKKEDTSMKATLKKAKKRH